jgi:hypothetical protein
MEVSDDADAVGEPEIRIELSQTKQTAYVAPGQDGIVTFTGQVTVSIPWSPNIQYLVVTLEVSCLDWPTSVPPALVFNKAQRQQSFIISVQVPIGTPASVKAILFVNGSWQYSPGITGGECDGASAMIIIAQYHSFLASPKSAVTYVEEDSFGEVPFTIENLGNGDDRVRMEIKNVDELEEYGITAAPLTGSVKLPYDEIVEASIMVSMDYNVIFDTYAIEVRFISEIAESLGHISDIEEVYAYLEVVPEGELPEPEPEPEPDPEPEPEPGDDEEPDDDDEPPLDGDDDSPGDVPGDDDDDVPSDDNTTDDDVSDENETSGNTSIETGDDSGGIGLTVIFIMIGVVILIFLLAGAYIIVRKGRKTGT